MISLNICNNTVILAALVIYSYTIVLLRSAIAKCASFDFETTGTYMIAGLYCFNLLTQGTFLLTYALSDYSIII